MCTWSEKRLPLAKEPMPISALYLQHSDTLVGGDLFAAYLPAFRRDNFFSVPKL